MTSFKISKINFSFTISNINALFAPVNKGLNFASIRLQQLFSKYFRYVQMTSLKFFNNSTGVVDNSYAQFAPVNIGLNSSYIMLQQLFRKNLRYARMTSLKIKIIISPLSEHISCLNSVFESTSGMRKWRHPYLKQSLNSLLLLETFMRSYCWWIED